MTELRKLATEVCEIAKAAGKAIMEIYMNYDDFGVEAKADNSPLTAADRASNQIINEGLQHLDTKYPIISEENDEVPYDIRKSYEYYWLVDPLDGTKEFLKRNGEFTVNIALVYRHEVVMGVVYAPEPDDLFWAAKGDGAFFVKNDEHQQLNAPGFTLQDKALKLVCSRSHLNPKTEAFVQNFDQPELVAKGSSLKFTIIAKGDAHIYPRLAPTMEWDTAAAQIVLEEAGGKVLNAATKQPLRYNKTELLNPHFIAYGNALSE